MDVKKLVKRIVFRGHADAQDQLSAITLGIGDVAIDCGANVGNITARMAEKGATVYAFEPNPYAFKALRTRFENQRNIYCINKGVLNRKGKARLYLHENAAQDQVWWSTGSSILKFKSNVNGDNFVDIEVVDLARFVQKLDRPIKVLKIDIEGAECAVVNRLIDTGSINRIEHVFVETHEQKIPELVADTEELRNRIARLGLHHIDLNWI